MKPGDSLLNAFMQSHNLFNLIKLTQASKGVVLSQIWFLQTENFVLKTYVHLKQVWEIIIT